MVTPARLITPDGKTIELTQETYQQIQNLLGAGVHIAQKTRRIAEIRATYGKYGGKPSLVQALLDERKAERIREDAKLEWHND